MDHAELRRRLKPILEAEERGDWDQVEQLSGQLNRELKGESSPEIVDHYLDNADLRKQAPPYGETQRRELRQFIDTGEHNDGGGTSIPAWSCGAVALLVVAAVIWLLK